MEKEMEKEANMIVMANYNMKGNFLMEKDGMEQEKNMINMEIQYLKENI